MTMMTYDELIKRLRNPWGYNGLISELTNSAADAIEELQKLSMRQEIKLVKLTGELTTKMMKQVAYWMPPKEE